MTPTTIVVSDALDQYTPLALSPLQANVADASGLKEQVVSHKSQLLSALFPTFVNQVEEYLHQMTGSPMTRGTPDHHANLSTTQGTEALLRSAYKLAQSDPMRLCFDIAGTRDSQLIELTIQDAINDQVHRTYEANRHKYDNSGGGSSGGSAGQNTQ